MRAYSPRRFWLLVRRSSPLDRIAVGVLVLYVLERLATDFGLRVPLSSLLTLLSLMAAAYLVVRLIPWVRRRLLWRLRNRLVVAYIFMAVVPVVLLLSMAGLALYLLELQIGAHLLRDDLHSHYDIIAADTAAIAAALSHQPGLKPDTPVSPTSTAVEDPILSRPGVASVIAAAQAKWPALRAYVNHGQQLVRAAHGSQFAGLAEFRNQLWYASAVSLPISQGHTTVLVVAPITSETLNSLPSKLGPIELTLLAPAAPGAGGRPIILLNNARYVLGERIASNNRPLAPAINWFDPPLSGLATLEAERADLGPDTVERPVLAQFSFRGSAVNRDLLTSVGYLAPAVLDVLGIASFVFLLLEIGALATGVVLTRTITRSIADLYEGTLHVRRGDFGHRVRVLKRDQLGALAESFNEMTGSITELIEEQRQRQLLEHEVAIAREVQQQLFPHSVPSVPGLDLSAICRPARVVSGDYYDFVPLGPGRIGIALADISGKGIFAALLMASLQAALRSTAAVEENRGAAELVRRLNQHLFKNTSDDRYATLFYAVYDSTAKTLTYTNAGHVAPIFVSNGCTRSLDQGGTVIGLFEDAQYTESTFEISPGSLLVGFSDGLTEPESVYGEEYGIARLKAEILRQRSLPANRLAENLVSGVEQWGGAAEQADDMTIVVAHMT
jgi:phosphoserine phosphatase RsbU/P